MNSALGDVIILCGGLGTRLRSVISDLPKPMAPVAGEPFLDLLLKYIMSFGFKRFILCTGYRSQDIQNHYQAAFPEVELIISEEPYRMGTAGAVKHAQPHIRTQFPFVVMNGDSFCPLDFHDFLQFHQNHAAEISIALSENKKEQDYGLVLTGTSERVLAFHEKGKRPASDAAMGRISAGIYVWESTILEKIPIDTVYSIELDLFPSLLNHPFYGYPCGEDFLDIGTPERYREAQTSLLKKITP